MRFRASDVAAATGGRLAGPDVELDGVSFDSRTLQPGQLFVPIVAERDGHAFIDAALDRGANGYLTSQPPSGPRTAIVVADTLRALMALAAAQRTSFEGPVIGVTGSVGKTSTKDFAHAALSASRRTWSNERSFNNEQGLPTTVLNAPHDAEVMVLEMGMRGHGEITELCAVARPTIGVVTRVAEAHSERVGGLDGVARAKGELIEALPSSGTAVLNADDERVSAMASRTSGRVMTFGVDEQADVRVTDLALDEHARASFTVHSPWGSHAVRLGVAGRHMATNAAAALACVGAVDADVAAGAAALSAVSLSSMRMAVHRTHAGAIVIDDSYNANPTSMRAALDALVDLPGTRKIAVLGLMAEIAAAEDEHRAIAEYAHGHGIELIAVGTDLYGVRPVPDPVAALGSLARGEAVLVKGSRVVGLERVAAALLLDQRVDASDVAVPGEDE